MDAFLHGSSPQEQLLERELQVYGVNKKVMLLKIGKQLQLQRHKLLEKSVD